MKKSLIDMAHRKMSELDDIERHEAHLLAYHVSIDKRDDISPAEALTLAVLWIDNDDGLAMKHFMTLGEAVDECLKEMGRLRALEEAEEIAVAVGCVGVSCVARRI